MPLDHAARRGLVAACAYPWRGLGWPACPSTARPTSRPKTLLITLTGQGPAGRHLDAVRHPGRVRRCRARHRADRAPPPARARRARDGAARLEGAAATRWSGSAGELDMQVEVDRGIGDNRSRREGRSHVTVLGHAPAGRGRWPRSPAGSPTSAPTSTGSSGWRATRSPRSSCTSPARDPDRLRMMLAEEAAAQSVDVAVQPANLLRHGMRLVVMDVDSTLVQGEVIEMLAEHAGCLDEVARVTESAMRGELDFEESLRERVALLEGLDASALDEVYDAHRARAGRAHDGAHAQAARLPLRDRLRRLQPGHRPDRRGPRHRLRRRQRARGGRRPAHRPDRRADRGPRRQGRRAAPLRRRGPGSPRPPPWRSATAPTTSTCSPPPDSGIAFNAKPVVQQAADTA